VSDLQAGSATISLTNGTFTTALLPAARDEFAHTAARSTILSRLRQERVRPATAGPGAEPGGARLSRSHALRAFITLARGRPAAQLFCFRREGTFPNSALHRLNPLEPPTSALSSAQHEAAKLTEER
jgi:hypothetical protein